MNGVMSTPIIWPTKSTNEESLQLMKGCGMTLSSTLSEGSETQEKKNDPGPFYNALR